MDPLNWGRILGTVTAIFLLLVTVALLMMIGFWVVMWTFEELFG